MFRRRLLVGLAAVITALLCLPSFASAVSFKPAPSSPLSGVGATPSDTATGDFNGDGKDDIAVASWQFPATGDLGVYIELSNGDGTFTPTPSSPIAVTYDQPQSIRTADFNSDGKLDLLVGLSGNSLFGSYLGNGAGGFTHHVDFYANQGIMSQTSIAIGDVNADGHVDVAFGYYGSKYSVALGDGAGGFTGNPSLTMPGTPGQGLDGFLTIAIGDFDDNGDQDLSLGLEPCTFDPDPPNYCPDMDPGMNAIFVAEGDGTGDFTPATGNPHLLQGGAQAKVRSMAIGHFNGDMIPDLAVTTSNDNVQTFLGDDQDFLTTNPDPNGIVSTGSGPASIQVGDFDLDGKQDLGWANAGDVGIALRSGASASGFLTAAGSPFATANPSLTPMDLSTGDFNDDGAPDLAAATSYETPGVIVLMSSPNIVADPLSFGAQKVGTTSASKSVRLRSTGALAATINSITGVGSNPYEFSMTGPAGCLGTLSAGSTCDVGLTFSPTGPGPRTATIQVNYAGSATPLQITVSGEGVEPLAMASTGSIDFGQVAVGGTDAVRTVTLNSTGSAPLSVSEVSIAGLDLADFDVVSENCTTGPLAANGGSCSTQIAMAPGTAGNKSAQLRFHHDAEGSPTAVELTGTATAPVPKVSLKLKSAGKVKRGRKLVITAKVTNTGRGTIAGITAGVVVGRMATAPKKVKLGSLAPGKSVTRKFKVAVKKSAKPGGKLAVTVTVTAAGRKLTSARRVARIKK